MQGFYFPTKQLFSCMGSKGSLNVDLSLSCLSLSMSTIYINGNVKATVFLFNIFIFHFILLLLLFYVLNPPFSSNEEKALDYSIIDFMNYTYEVT